MKTMHHECGAHAGAAGIRARLAVPLLLLACAAALPAAAQTVYRCTAPDGKISYGEIPCPDSAAAARTLPAPPPADPAAAAAAAADLSRQRKQANALAKDRQKREASDAREQARNDRAAAAYRKKCARLQLHKQWADNDLKSASPKQASLASAKAGHAADQLALECPK